jgi:hypothetical protein
MCSHPPTVRLVLGTPAADGSILTRAWTICAYAAEGLADQLGPPEAESFATAEVVDNVATALYAVPGVIRTGGPQR